MHVVVLCGGRSAEHDVSFMSAASVLNHLDSSKYKISVVGIQKDGDIYSPELTMERLDLKDLERLDFPAADNWVCLLVDLKPEIVFPVLHGPFGEDGTVQGIFECLNIPYVGAGVSASAVGMNKIHSKKILRQEGLPVLPCVALTRSKWQEDSASCQQRIAEQLNYPLFVKPSNLGSSVGISRSRSGGELAEHIDLAFQYDDFILVEQGIDAREIEVSVLGNSEPEVSVAGEIIPAAEFYSYEAKYLDKGSQLLIPAPLSEEQMKEVRSLSRSAFRALQLEGMARVDFLMEKQTGQFWVNESNTIPGFTQISMYPKLWEASGVSYPELLDRLIEFGLQRHRRRSRLSVDP